MGRTASAEKEVGLLVNETERFETETTTICKMIRQGGAAVKNCPWAASTLNICTAKEKISNQ